MERKEGGRRRQREVPHPLPFFTMSTVPSGVRPTDSIFPLEQSRPHQPPSSGGQGRLLGEKTVCLFIESRGRV